jgi:hypothetical protein
VSTAGALEHGIAGGGFALRFGGAEGHERVVPCEDSADER